MLDLRRLAVFVGAEEADIEIEARIFEIVRIATEESNLLLRREDKTNIGVALEAIKVIKAALVEGDNVAAQTGFVLGLFFDLGHDGAAGPESLFVGKAGLDGGIHAGGHILDAHEDIQLEVFGGDFLFESAGHEAVLEVIVLLAADLLQGVGADVMIGHDEAVLGYEGAGAAAVEANGGFLDMFEPGV